MSMNTLTSPPLSSLLVRLFADAQTTDSRFAELPAEERAALMAAAKVDYGATYARVKHMFLAVSPQTGVLLYMLARSMQARVIVEFGTSFGISTRHLAAALKDNGGGQLIGTELEPAKAEQARKHIAEARLSEYVEIREGDAIESLARDLPARIDLVLLDGAKVLYPRILALLEPHFAPGTLVVADNADESAEYLDRVRRRGAYLSVPFARDVELSQWLG
jgi:predicted O-methyltransferase YrrM